MDGSDYITNYRLLYTAIDLVSERLNLKLVTTKLYEGIELLNLQSLKDALKNSYPSVTELFKKMPLRHLYFINPQSKATMKSITKHLESQKLSIVMSSGAESGGPWTINTCSSQEALTASTMRLMALFQKFIESARSQMLANSLTDQLRSQISANKEMTDRISKISKQLSKILQRDCPPREKLEKLLTAVENLSDKEALIDLLLQVIGEWIPDMPKTHAALCSDIDTTNQLLESFNSILDLVRLIPYDEQSQAEDRQLIEHAFRVANSFMANKIILPTSFTRNLCRVVRTVAAAIDGNVKSELHRGIPELRKIIHELKRCYTIDFNGASAVGSTNSMPDIKISRTPGVTTTMPFLTEIVDKVAVQREEVTVDTILASLGALPDMRKELYRNLQAHNIEWSDEYFTELYKQLTALLDLSK